MKRWICMLLTLGLLLTVCAGCRNTPSPDGGDGQTGQTGQTGQHDADAEDEAGENIYTAITGIPADEPVYTVAGNPIPAELYFYWLTYNAGNTAYQLQTYAAYGIYSNMFDENGALVWDNELTEGQTLRAYVEGSAEYAAVFYATLENMAAQNGVELTDEDRTAMASDLAAVVEQAGGEDAFRNQLFQMGLSQASYDRVDAAYYLFAHLTELAQQENSALYLEDAGYERYGTYADHILLATIDLNTQEPLSEEEIAQKRTTAEDLLSQLQAAEDVETLFTQLADQYSEDTGRVANPDGYIYTPGTMVTEFEDAAAALAPGEISGIVETRYGYHILLRKDLSQGLAAHPEQRATLASAYINDLIVGAMGEDVVRSETLNSVDTAAFYDAYVEALTAMNTATE